MIALIEITMKAHRNEIGASLANLRHIANLGSTASVRASIERNPYVTKVKDATFGREGNAPAVYRVDVERLASQTCTPISKDSSVLIGVQVRDALVNDTMTYIGNNAFSTGQSVDAKNKSRREHSKWPAVPQGLGKNVLDVILLMLHEGIEDERELAVCMNVSVTAVKGCLKKLEEHDLDPDSPSIWDDVTKLEPKLRTWRIGERRELTRHEIGYYFAMERADSVTSDDERQEHLRFAAWHLNRGTVIRAALDDCSEDEAMGVVRNAEYARRAKRSYHINRAKEQSRNDKRVWDERKHRREFHAAMRKQNIPPSQWHRYRALAHQAETYDETELVFKTQEMSIAQMMEAASV
jgi:hypothetical protein